MDIAEKVKEILVRQLGIEKETVAPSSTLADLGADSLDEVEIVMVIEEEFDIEISDEDAEKVTTVQDMCDLIGRLR